MYIVAMIALARVFTFNATMRLRELRSYLVHTCS